MPEGPVRVAIVGDDEAHRILAEHLADEVSAGVSELASRRRFVGDGKRARFYKIGARPPKPRGPGGRPEYRAQRSAGAPAGYAAVLVEAVREVVAEADVVLVLADEDGEGDRMNAPGRCGALLGDLRRRVVVGVCNPVAEAWFIAFVADTHPDRAAQLDRQAGRPASRRPHLLCSRPSTALHHAKRALRFLRGDAETLSACSAVTLHADELEALLVNHSAPLGSLRELGECGLGGFIEALETTYVPRLLAPGPG